MLRHTPTLNRGDPLARGLVCLMVGGYPVDLVTGRRATIGSNTQTVVSGRTRWGKAFESNVTTGAEYVSVVDTFTASRITTQHTFFAAADLDTLVASGPLITIPYTGAVSDPYFTLGFDDSGGADGFDCSVTVGGGRGVYEPGGTYFTTGPRTYGWSRDADVQSVYRDGKLTNTGNANVFGGSMPTGNADFGGGATEIVVNGFSTANPSQSFNGRVAIVAIWERPLSAAEHAALSRDPERLIRPPGSPTDLLGLLAPVSADTNVTPAAVAASFTIPTPVVKTGIWKVSDQGVRNSTSTGTAVVTLTDPTTIAVGNYLVARVAVDNSGTNGALPGLAVTDSRSHTWTLETGANQDPGTASAGASCYLAYVRVVTPFQAADTVTFTWTTGTPRSAIVLVEWTGIHDTTPRAVTSTRANNVSSTAQPTGAITPTAANQLVFVTAAAEQLGTEWGAQDTDTTNGVWVDVPKDSANTGTHDTSMSVYGGYKLVTASGAQTWNNTLSATGDWATVSIVFGPDIHENIYTVTALPAAFVIPTPTIDIPTGTNVTPTAVAATFTVPTPSIANITNVTPTAVAATFVIPTPAITVTTRPTPTAVAATFVVPTPTFTRTTTPTPTAVAATFVIPTPVVSTSVSATLTAVAGTFVIPTPTVSTGVIVNATAAAATFTVPTPTRTATANVAVTAVAASFTIPTPSVTTGSNTFVSVTAVAATFVVPTPAIAGTQVTPTAVAATFTVPTPAIAGTQVAATAAAATFVIPTPSVTTGSNTFVNVTAVALVAVIPTPTFNRTTTPTPAAVAMLMAVPAPGRTASANILATVLQAVFAIGTHIPTGQVIGGNVTSTVVLVGDVTTAVARYGTTAGVALANNVTVVIDQ